MTETVLLCQFTIKHQLESCMPNEPTQITSMRIGVFLGSRPYWFHDHEICCIGNLV